MRYTIITSKSYTEDEAVELFKGFLKETLALLKIRKAIKIEKDMLDNNSFYTNSTKSRYENSDLVKKLKTANFNKYYTRVDGDFESIHHKGNFVINRKVYEFQKQGITYIIDFHETIENRYSTKETSYTIEFTQKFELKKKKPVYKLDKDLLNEFKSVFNEDNAIIEKYISKMRGYTTKVKIDKKQSGDVMYNIITVTPNKLASYACDNIIKNVRKKIPLSIYSYKEAFPERGRIKEFELFQDLFFTFRARLKADSGTFGYIGIQYDDKKEIIKIITTLDKKEAYIEV